VIDAAQRRDGIVGDLLEIGCYRGASAVLLGYMREGDQRLVVCDLFDGQTKSPEDDVERERFYTPGFNLAAFEANYLRFHDVLPEIIATPSSDLYEAGLGRTFRFVHIDGSHAYSQVRLDLLLAKQLLVSGGVVVFDDLLSRHTPGVTAAVWEGVLQDGLIPMFQTIKFYGSWDTPPHVEIPTSLTSFSHEVCGHHMAHIEDR
jgi:hypothetical protein